MPRNATTTSPKTPPLAVEAVLTSKGQLTLPKSIRRRLGVQAGSRVRFTVAADGKVQVEQATHSLKELWEKSDAREKPGPVMSFEEMDEAKARRIW